MKRKSNNNNYLNISFSSSQETEEGYHYFLNSNKDDLEHKFDIHNLIGNTNDGTLINIFEEEKIPKIMNDVDDNKNKNNGNKNKSINKPFVAKKRGRPGKNSKKIIKDKTKGKYRPGNVCFKIYVSCMKNIHYFLNKKFKGLELHFPTVTNNKKKSHVAQRELFNKTIYELYCENQITRSFKGRLKINEKNKEQRNSTKIEKYNDSRKNQKEIDSYFEKNKNKNEEIFKIIKFQDFLKAYLNNDKEIIIKEKNNSSYHLDLTGFETYEQSFNSEYSKDEKEEYKQYVFKIMNNKSKDRKNTK